MKLNELRQELRQIIREEIRKIRLNENEGPQKAKILSDVYTLAERGMIDRYGFGEDDPAELTRYADEAIIVDELNKKFGMDITKLPNFKKIATPYMRKGNVGTYDPQTNTFEIEEGYEVYVPKQYIQYI
jgi:hypothetical protein